MTPTHLHIYLCPTCKMLAASSVKIPTPLRCPTDWTWMRFQYAAPIETDGQREIAKVGLLFNPFVPPVKPEDRMKKCGRTGCLTHRRQSELLNGRFCSEACGAQDSKDMEAMGARLKALYERKPWLRPRVKETA